jgi:hypothetical protein
MKRDYIQRGNRQASERDSIRKCHFQHQEYSPKDLCALGYGLGFNAQYAF